MRSTRMVWAALAALISLSATASALAAQQGLELGFRGGASVSSASLDASETFSKSNRTGFVGGIFLNYDAGPLGFQVAGEYTQKGVDLNLGDAVDNFRLDYLEIPLVLKLGIPLDKIKPSVFGGVGLGFKTKCSNEGSDCGDEFESTDVSGILGADVALYLGGFSLWADGRYHYSMNDISRGTSIVSDLKNRNWTFQGGIAFKVGG